MKETIRKQKLFLFSLIGVVVTSFALLTTFAYQTIKVDLVGNSDDSLSVTSGVLDVTYTSSNTVNITNMPLLNSYKTADYTEFEIDNTKSTEDVLYRLKLVDLSYSDNLTNGDFRYTIVSLKDDKETIISESTFDNLNESEYVFSTKYDNYLFIKSGEVQKLRIYFWLQETQSDQNYLENTKFLGKMQIESILSRDSQERVIMNFKVYGNTIIEDNEYSIDNPRNIKSLGKLVTNTNDTNYGKYQIDINVSGNNIFKTDEEFIIDNNWAYQTLYLNKGTYRINYLSSDFNSYKVLDENNHEIITEQSINKSFDIKESGDYKVYIGGNNYKFNVGDKPSTYNAILSYGDKSINYEPYTVNNMYSIFVNKPLSCIDNICDYIDLIDGVLYRQVGYMNLNGKENWEKNDTTYSIKIKNVGNSFSPISTHLNEFSIDNGLLSIVSNIDDINVFRSNLMSDNIKVIYPLKDIEKEAIGILNISDLKEKNIIVTDGNINSSKIVIDYNK